VNPPSARLPDRTLETMKNQPTIALTDLEPDDFVGLALSAGGKPFHGKMLRKWLYKHRAASFDAMTDLPHALRERLEESHVLHRLTEVAAEHGQDGTSKYAFGLGDGSVIETVALPSRNRTTLCLSTQVGCAMGCRFCASGLKGFGRNLTAGEIVEQFLLGASRSEWAVSNVVFMGTGEPLLNLDNLIRAIKILNHRDCVNFGARRITVSTIGIPEKMIALADCGLQVNLAVSLHAPNDALRQGIIPTARSYSIAEILDAAVVYRKKTTRDVTFEYVLLGGVNDAPEHAEELARLLRPYNCMVNLIAFNSVPGIGFEPPSQGGVPLFLKILQQKKIPVTVRRSRGRDIKAACGQLLRVGPTEA